MNVLTRSYTRSRTGANTSETALTPARVASNVLVKSHSLDFMHAAVQLDKNNPDDPRLEAQPLYVAQLVMKHDNKAHDVVFVCTMANNVWAFDVKDGSFLWKTNLGTPITPAPKPHLGFPKASEIDLWGVNIRWGILSTPVIDLDHKKLYAVAWTSADGSVAKSQYELHELDITDGGKLRNLQIQASAPGQALPGETPATFMPSKQKQRASLLLTKPSFNGQVKNTLFIPFSILTRITIRAMAGSSPWTSRAFKSRQPGAHRRTKWELASGRADKAPPPTSTMLFT